MKIAVLTSVHPRTDTRIRVKQLPSIVKLADTQVRLFVMDGKGDEVVSGVQIIDLGSSPRSRFSRALSGNWRMWCACRRWKANIVHFHDPELIIVGFALKIFSTKIIYDVHEDVPRQVLAKYWIPPILRRPVAVAASAFEWLAAKSFDGVVTATQTIANRFPENKTVTVQNFPILQELVASESAPYTERAPHFTYVGGITAIRGSFEMVRAIGRVSNDAARLQLAGNFSPQTHKQELEQESGWKRVDFKGWASRAELVHILSTVRAGLVVLHPTRNYPDALPVKMFEYMAAGLPVIASDFRLWRQIVDRAGCGLLVDPLDPDAIAVAMQWLLNHPEEAEAMGRQGRKAVEEIYNWEPEAEKLTGLYRCFLQG